MNRSDNSGNNDLSALFANKRTNVELIKQLGEPKLFNLNEIQKLVRYFENADVTNGLALLKATLDFFLLTESFVEGDRLQNKNYISNLHKGLTTLVDALSIAINNSSVDKPVLLYCEETIDKRLQSLKSNDKPLHDICYEKLRSVITEGNFYRKK